MRLQVASCTPLVSRPLHPCLLNTYLCQHTELCGVFFLQKSSHKLCNFQNESVLTEHRRDLRWMSCLRLAVLIVQSCVFSSPLFITPILGYGGEGFFFFSTVLFSPRQPYSVTLVSTVSQTTTKISDGAEGLCRVFYRRQTNA